MLPSNSFTPQNLIDLIMIEQIAKQLGIKDPEYFSLLSHAEQWSVLKITAFMDKKFDILDGMKSWENQFRPRRNPQRDSRESYFYTKTF